MEYLITVVFILSVVIIASIINMQREKNRIYSILRDSFGKHGEDEISHNHMVELKKTVEDKNDVLPDSVWNDLNMDSVFQYLNQSVSAIGEEYLYQTLHTLLHDNSILEKRSELAKELSDKELSLRIRYKLCGIKKQEYNTVYSSIKKLSQASATSTLFHVLCFAVFIVAFIFMFVSPDIGVMVCIGVACFNCFFYFSKKNKLAKYDEAVQNIVKWLNVTAELVKEKDSAGSQLKKLMENMSELLEKFNSFRRFSWLLQPKSAVGSLMDMLLDYVKFLTHIDLIKFNLAIKKLRIYEKELMELYSLTGELELGIITAGIFAMDRETVIPELSSESKLYINAEELTHPLLFESVPNDCKTENNLLLTGSNASGKSTYLKMVGVNIILAQTMHVVFGKNFKSVFADIGTSINISDDILSGDSFYLAEIKRIKTLIEAVDTGKPIIIFIDEILKGTNTNERIAASAEILRYFAKDNVLVLAATHDIELTELLDDKYDNYYFTENVNLSNIFDYKLRKGVVYTSNAIKLLERYGYPKTIINNSYRYLEEKCTN